MSTATRSPVETLFIQSATLLQQGLAAEAKKGLMKVVKKLPDSAPAWYNLALSHQHLGEHHPALKAYQKTVRLRPDMIDARINMGMSYKALGQEAEAEKAARDALAQDPDHPRALNLLGTIEAERGETEKARSLFEASLKSLPDFGDARLNLANLLLENGNAAGAQEILTPLLAGEPDNREYLRVQCLVHMDTKNLQAASPILVRLLEAHPDDEDIKRLNLKFREAIRDHFGALDAATELLEKFPEDPILWNSLGNAYFQLDSPARARECYEKAISLKPDHAEYENNLGLAYSSMGDKSNAEQHYRRSIEINPAHAEAWRNLAALKKFKSLDDPDARSVNALWDTGDLDELSTIKLAFAFGKILDDCGEYDRAFEVYGRGNELKFGESRIDLDKFYAHIDRIDKVLDRPPQHPARQTLDVRPIFIVGMPRSGTTLAEQIISRHPEVTGCGELPCIERAIGRIEKKSELVHAYPDDFPDAPAELFEAEAREYLNWVRKLHDLQTPQITDKMPFNFVHVWLIKALFPESPVVYCQRHPLDVITSNYFQLYGSDISFVYDLDRLTQYYVRHHRLMQHWIRIFGDGIHVLRYETVVQDSDNQTRRLIDAVGLPWNDACLDQKRSTASVRTASIWQVRQGIYTTSKERWRNYEKFYTGVIAALEAEGIVKRAADATDDEIESGSIYLV